LASSDGGVFTFGASTFYGSGATLSLNKPVVAIAGTFLGNGYTLGASDGGIFTYGDSTFCGAAGTASLSSPIVGLAFF
jgi:hypothetical protein